MAATAVTRKIRDNFKLTSYHVTAEGPSDVAWVDFADFENFAAVVVRATGTGGLDELKILGNSAADGSGTDVTIVDEGTVAATADAAGDYIVIECDAQMAAEAGTAAGVDVRGISVSLGHAVATETSSVTYILGGPRWATGSLTTNNIA